MVASISSLLLLIPVQVSVCIEFSISVAPHRKQHTLEPFPNVGHLLVNPLLFEFAYACTADVRDELAVCRSVKFIRRVRVDVPASNLAYWSPWWYIVSAGVPRVVTGGLRGNGSVNDDFAKYSGDEGEQPKATRRISSYAARVGGRGQQRRRARAAESEGEGSRVGGSRTRTQRAEQSSESLFDRSRLPTAHHVHGCMHMLPLPLPPARTTISVFAPFPFSSH